MSKTRAKHSPEFKARVALAAVREQDTVAEISRRYKIHANMVYKWRQVLLDNLPRVFNKDEAIVSHTSEREAELLQKIGELTVERDFLSNGLARSR
jgi:transposase-like protein